MVEQAVWYEPVSAAGNPGNREKYRENREIDAGNR